MNTDPISVFFNAVDEAEAAVRAMFLALREGGGDLADSNLARRLRSIDTALTDIRAEVEDAGLES